MLFYSRIVASFCLALCLGLALVCLLPLHIAYANGVATTEVFSGPAGSYRVVVYAIGPRLVLGNAHLTMLLYDRANDTLITDAHVAFSARGPEGASLGPISAYHELTTPQYYDVNLPVDVEGEWDFTIAIDGRLGAADVTFPLMVEQPVVNWGAVMGMLVLLLLIVPFIVVGARSLRGRGDRGASGNSTTH